MEVVAAVGVVVGAAVVVVVVVVGVQGKVCTSVSGGPPQSAGVDRGYTSVELPAAAEGLFVQVVAVSIVVPKVIVVNLFPVKLLNSLDVVFV